MLSQRGAPDLHIPVNAEGSEALFDAFAALPGLRTEHMLAQMQRLPAFPTVIWQKARPSPRPAAALTPPGIAANCSPEKDARPSGGPTMSIPQTGGGPIEHQSQLAEYLAAGCKPPEDWRIGTEHEKFGYCKDTSCRSPMRAERSVRAVLEGCATCMAGPRSRRMASSSGWRKDGANVSLEPGGQLELSGAPLENIHQTCNEVNLHLAEVKDVADKVGVGFIGLGAAPIWSHEQMPMMPKGRYKLMDSYMQRVGTMGQTMMRRTCTVQVNLDFAAEADMVQKLRVALALQPVATALFANSPFLDGKPNGHKSWRARVWRDLDPDRTGMLPFVFEDGFGFEAYADYALDVPMYFVYREGRYVDALGPVVSRFPAWRVARAARREADAVGLGRSPDHDLSRGADQEIHGDARRRWRAVAPACARCRPSGSG